MNLKQILALLLLLTVVYVGFSSAAYTGVSEDNDDTPCGTPCSSSRECSNEQCSFCNPDTYTCSLRLRKNQMNMTRTEIDRFVGAINRMKALGIYDQFVLLHAITYPEIRYGPVLHKLKCVDQAEKYRLSEDCLNWAHKGNLFLPWHRQFLREFEKQLAAIDPEVTVPYWGWGSGWPGQESVDPQVNHLFADYFMGGNGDPNHNFHVMNGSFAQWPLRYSTGLLSVLTRQFDGTVPLPSSEHVLAVLNTTMYDLPVWQGPDDKSFTFRNMLEGNVGLEGWIGPPFMHNRVHVNTGGCMNRDSSPNDPLFWLHHAEVDRLWAIWQKKNPGATYVPVDGPAPPGTLRHEYMAPWDGKFNTPDFHYWYRFQVAAPESTRTRISDMDVDITTLGYRYDNMDP